MYLASDLLLADRGSPSSPPADDRDGPTDQLTDRRTDRQAGRAGGRADGTYEHILYQKKKKSGVMQKRL